MYISKTITPKSGFVYKEEYKKIALRFLKEAGVLTQWHLYIHKKGYCSDFNGKRMNSKNWYDVEFIDRIFGRTLFTDFLEESSNLIIEGFSMSDLFRTYIRKNYPNEYHFRCPNYVKKHIAEAIEKAGTFKIVEFQKYISQHEK